MTTSAIALEGRLSEISKNEPASASACAVVGALAEAGAEIAALLSLGALGRFDATVGVNTDGDAQKEIDLRTQDILMRALRSAPVAALASEELDEWLLVDPSAPLAVAFDPLDGSGNVGVNGAMGTIFSILPARAHDNPFVGPRSSPLAAGFFLYGAQTSLIVSFGAGVDVFTLDRAYQTWRLAEAQIHVPSGVPEFAINVSNYRHWDPAVRTYVDDCISGSEGPRGRDFNMRWLGALVGEAFRILSRGGVYLYPADSRKTHRDGRLRLLYEAHPIAFLIEQAGGRASTGRARILDQHVFSLHQRTPFIFGSAEKVALIERLHAAPESRADSAPLFGARGLFRV
jgi:fructose-1,6-bisphosphatase I